MVWFMFVLLLKMITNSWPVNLETETAFW